MKTLNNQIEQFQLVELSQNELIQVTGGSWLTDLANNVGYVVGYFAHAVVDAALVITGNFGAEHN